jgi:hypothetical protein
MSGTSKNKSEVVQSFEDSLAGPVGDMFESAGKFGSVFAAIALLAAIGRVFIPDLDRDLEPLLKIIPQASSLRPTSLISSTIFISAIIFFLSIFCNLMRNLVFRIGQVILSLLNKGVTVSVKVAFGLKNIRLAKQLNRLSHLFKRNVFFQDLWLARSQGEFLSLRVPFTVENFSYAKCNLKLIKVAHGYWRAGIFLGSLQGDHYIFHLYEDHERDCLKTRILWRTPFEERLPDSRKEISHLVDPKEIKMEIRRKEGRIFLAVNGVDVDQFKVPLTSDSSVYFAAWADGNPVEIQLGDLEVAA